MGLWLAVAAALLVGGCGDKKTVEPIEDGPEVALLGTWETRGVDATLGPVLVHMHLREQGNLAMTLVLEGGAQRSFPGTWFVAGEELVLRGVYFGAGEESRVRWNIDEQGALILRDDSGAEQEWVRLR